MSNFSCTEIEEAKLLDKRYSPTVMSNLFLYFKNLLGITFHLKLNWMTSCTWQSCVLIYCIRMRNITPRYTRVLARLSIHCFRDAVNYHRDFKIQRRDGNENVALKVNLLSFSLYRNYSCPLTLTYVGEPSWSWIPRDHIRVQKEKFDFVVACLRPHKTLN